MSKKGGDSSKWILESIEIDRTTDLPTHNNNNNEDENSNRHQSRTSPGLKAVSFRRAISNAAGGAWKKNNGPKMGRVQSSAARGLKSLRFLDGAGKDGDSWKPILRPADLMLLKDTIWYRHLQLNIITNFLVPSA